MKLKYSYLILVVIFLLYWSCANISQPTGGPKDTLAPVLLTAQPANKSLNVKSKTVKLTFDEFIKVDNIKNQLIIIPNIKGEYKSRVIKNYIELEFEEPFEENTTYTFNFRDAIKDITEGNKTLDVKLAFSTGNYIDSLTIEGEVRNLLSNKTEEKTLVALYRAKDTLNIFNEKPVYFTYTDKEGKYKIENIKNANYKIYALKDKNNNLKADQEEAYAFKADTIHLDENKKIDLKVIKLNNKSPKIQNKRPNGKYYEIKFNKHIVDYDLKIIDTSFDTTWVIASNLVDENKTLRVYNNLKLNLGDSINARLIYSDSLNQQKKEELYIKFTESKKQKEKFSSEWEVKNSVPMNRPLKIKLKFNKPVRAINYDSITIHYDSTSFETFTDLAQISWNKTKTELSLEKIINREKIAKTEDNKLLPITIKAGKGAFVSIEADTSELFTKDIKLRREDEYGVLKGRLTTDYPSFFIQLINTKNEVIAEIKNKKDYEFKTIEPGDYFIRILIDENDNGKWEIGNVNKNIEPEKIVFFEEPVTIRANWEIENKEIVL